MSAAPTKLRLLYVITDLLTGGVPLHLYRLCVRMAGQGFQPTVFCLAPPGPVSDLLARAGIEVVHGNARSSADISIIFRLAKLLRLQKPDVVHSFLFHANIASRVARFLAGYPVSRLLCEIQTVEIERSWHLCVDGLTQTMCRCEIGNSPSVIEHLAVHAHFQRNRLELVRGGIDPQSLDDAPRRPRSHWGLPESVPLGLWVGRLDPVKGLEVLIAAAALVNHSRTFHLALVGSGEYKAQVIGEIEKHGLSERAHFLGRRDDVASLLKIADLFVFPSYTEGLPNAVLEAMAARLPIVTTDVPGCRDLIVHERNGLLVPPGDATALANAMLRLLNDRDLAHALGTRARQDIDETWSIERTYESYQRLYRQTLLEPVRAEGSASDGRS